MISANAQSEPLNSPLLDWQPVVLEGSQKASITSLNTGFEYQIYIDVPKGIPPQSGYPIIYALDGDSVFATLRQVNQLKHWRAKVTGYQQAIIVAIGYTQAEKNHNARARDYTPETKNAEKNSGGAAQFSAFIKDELKPLINQSFPVDQSREAIFGHSFGGLFVLHTLFKQPQLFTSYIASSPSIWWGDSMLLDNIDNHYVLPHNLLVTIGSLEGKLENRSAEVMKILASRKLLQNARLLKKILASSNPPQRFQYIELEGEDHGSAKYSAISRALNFFLLSAQDD